MSGPIHQLNIVALRQSTTDFHNQNITVVGDVAQELDSRLLILDSIEDILRLAESSGIGLIIIDATDPEQNPLLKARQLRTSALLNRTPLLFITERDEPERLTRFSELGNVDFLFSPLVRPVLHSKISSYCQIHRQAASLSQLKASQAAACQKAQRWTFRDGGLRHSAFPDQRRLELNRDAAAERERHVAIVNSTSDAMIATDERFRISLLNQAAEEMCGWSQEAAKGLPLEQVVTLLDPKTRTPRPPSNSTGDSLILTPDGKEHLVDDRLSPIKNCQGSEGGTVLVLRDVTSQRRMEMELQNHQRLESLGHLAGGIAHDFNNMLGVVLTSSSLALRQLPAKSQVRSCLQNIEETCDRAAGLTRQLLTFARGGAPVCELCNPENVIQEAVELGLRGGGTGCDVSLERPLWPSRLDVGQISQALSNIALGARNAMNDSGHITVRGRNVHFDDRVLPPGPGDYIEIAVQYEGNAPANLSLIFDPYYSVQDGHHGLGLASAFSIIQRHAGVLRAERQPPKGMRFLVYLRAEPSSVIEESPPESQEYAAHGRVLVMDDEPRLRELLMDCLVALQCESQCAAHGEEAIKLYREATKNGTPFDVVLLDLTIRGGIGGVETLRKLMEIDPTVCAIACSGYADDPVMGAHEQHGFADALEKPFRFAMLARAVRRQIAKKRRKPSDRAKQR